MKKTLMIMMLIIIALNNCKNNEQPENIQKKIDLDLEIIGSWIQADSNYINDTVSGFCQGIKILNDGTIHIYTSIDTSCSTWNFISTLPETLKYAVNGVWEMVDSTTGIYQIINHNKLKKIENVTNKTEYFNKGSF